MWVTHPTNSTRYGFFLDFQQEILDSIFGGSYNMGNIDKSM